MSNPTRSSAFTAARTAAFLASLALVGWAAVARAGVPTEPMRAAAIPDEDAAGRRNLERNLRWILAREREPGKRAATVGVYADAGAWHEGARSTTDALESAGVACKALDRTQMTARGLEGLRAVVLPGGWAPYQFDAIGVEGLRALRTFVESGGRCLGVCAGAYLFSREVVWEGARIPYPFGLYDGVATGPISSLAKWPDRAAVAVLPTEAGRRRGLVAGSPTFLYYGGPAFDGGTGVVVLSTYPDGRAATVAKAVGRGEVVLTGLHLERPAPATGGDDAPPPKDAGAMLRALIEGR